VPELTLSAIPDVLEGDEIPFVLGLSPDPRRCLEVGGAQYRRGSDRCQIDWLAEPLALRALLINAAGNTYLMASAGPLLSEWWPLLQRAGANPQRPLLSAGVAGSAQRFTHEALSVDISVAGPDPVLDHVAAVAGITGGLTDESLLFAHAKSLAVIKAALLLLAEYRTLVNPVPDIDVQAGAGTVSLESLLDVADTAASSIAWTHVVA